MPGFIWRCKRCDHSVCTCSKETKAKVDPEIGNSITQVGRRDWIDSNLFERDKVRPQPRPSRRT